MSGSPLLLARTPRPLYQAFRNAARTAQIPNSEAIRQSFEMFIAAHANSDAYSPHSLEDHASVPLPEPTPVQGWLGKEAAEPKRQRVREKRIPNRKLDAGMLREK